MTAPPTGPAALLHAGLESAEPSERLQAALSAGSRPVPEYAGVLVARCAVEPDFYVRDMLTWALTRLAADVTLPLLLGELRSGTAQARSQAFHTISKIGDRRAWPAITPEVLGDPDDDVARSAWRAAVALVAREEAGVLAATLTTHLGRGDRDVQLSLSRALVTLGDSARGALEQVAERGAGESRLHAIATLRLLDHPDEGFDASVHEAGRIVALLGAPQPDGPPTAEPGGPYRS